MNRKRICSILKRFIIQILVLGIIGSTLPKTSVGQPRRSIPSKLKDTTKPTSNETRLWYRQPAATWNEALPIGNGRLGAMIFGGVESERIQLNEDTIWAG